MGADRVEEVTVVADDEHRVLEFRQIVFKPRHCVEVKVVGRLVKKQVIGIAEQSLGKQHTHLLVGAHVAHQHVMLVFLDAETAQQSGSVALGVPALEFGEFLFKLRGAYAVGVAEIFFGIEGVFLIDDIPQHGVTLDDGVENREVVKLEVVLFENAHALARTLRHGAVCRAEFSAEHTHKRRLAGAVGANYTIAVAGREFKVHVLKQYSFTELNT